MEAAILPPILVPNRHQLQSSILLLKAPVTQLLRLPGHSPDPISNKGLAMPVHLQNLAHKPCRIAQCTHVNKQ